MREILIQLAFETGRVYQRLYDKLDLDNVINFNDIALANSCGAQWNIKGKMEDLPKLFQTHDIEQEKIKALNELAEQFKQIKNMADLL